MALPVLSFQETVAQVTAGLLSGDAARETAALIRVYHRKIECETPDGQVYYARLLQEVGAHQNGAVLKRYLHLMREALDTMRTKPELEAQVLDEGTSMSQYMAWAADSKVSASRTIKGEEGACETLLDYFIIQLCKTYADNAARPAFLFASRDHLALLRVGLEGIMGYTRISPRFRLLLMQRKEEILPTTAQLVSPRNLPIIPLEIAREQMANMAAQFVVHLADHTDSRNWLVDNGMLDICVGVLTYAKKELSTISKQRSGELVKIIAGAFFSVVTLRETGQKLQEQGALAALKPFKKFLGGQGNFLNYLSKDPVTLFDIPPFKDGQFVKTATACSWEACSVGVEPEGRKFGSCAKCDGAFYCGKEHQKLHWPIHKGACQLSRQAREAQPREQRVVVTTVQ